ncbi:FAD dependent oxidoreductase [Beggiatoa sp. PS]|nr:FAD dependent oxidoreductase [Beggiatoa sp. PS]
MRVCIIGGGASAMTSAKHLQEEGIEVEILEQRDCLGGLWAFDKNFPTVTDRSFASTSKTYLQFSDFPIDEKAHFFPHSSVYIDYLNSYVDTNNLRPLIKFNHKVTSLRKKGEQWEVTASHGDETYTNTVDAVVVCSGIHYVPLIPEVPDSENFEGTIIHSSLLGTANELAGKRVVFVGAGESTVDIAHDLVAESLCDDVYISVRKGLTVTRHWGRPPHLPADYDSTRAKVWLPRNFLHDYNRRDQDSAFRTFYTLLGIPLFLLTLPIAFKKSLNLLSVLLDWKTWVAPFRAPRRHGPASGVELCKACEPICKEPPQSEEEVEERFWKIKNAFDWYSGAMHNSQPFIKRPEFLKDIARKKIKLVPKIARFSGPREVEFEDGTKVAADVVVMGTGFKSTVSFLEQQEVDGRTLYKNVFLPDDPSLAFIGFVRANIGSFPTVSEMQARWVSGVWSERIKLPDTQQMKKTVKEEAEHYNQTRKLQVGRLTSLIDYHPYMTELAGYVGCRPELWRFLLKPKVLYILLFGPMASYQYKLHGYGANQKMALEALSIIPPLPFQRVMQHMVLYLFMKPLFSLLGMLGLRKFRPLL